MFVNYENRVLCIEGRKLYEDLKVLDRDNYYYMRNKYFKVVQGGGNGRKGLIAWESVPQGLQKKVLEKLNVTNLEEVIRESSLGVNPLEVRIKNDAQAAKFFSTHVKPTGKRLPMDRQIQLRTEAEILNAVIEISEERLGKRKAMGGRGGSYMWETMVEYINMLDSDKYPHSLPSNHRALQRKCKKYQDESYAGLLHGGEGNSNTRKVNDKLENLLCALYTMPNKPYTTSVLDLYLQFMGRSLDVVDKSTGELFDPFDFYKDGEPIIVSESTVWSYLNDPVNKPKIDKYRLSSMEYNNLHRPHHHRHAPMFSFSKISLDDRDLPRKMLNGKRVKAYYAYDVTSGCVVGASYSTEKKLPLFIDCMRDMFRFIHKHGIGVPMEVEVEHHLVNHFKNDLMKAGIVFPFVRWCNPGNSQEKRAEHFNREKKYGYEKQYQEGIGRFYAKLIANRTKSEKVFDSENDTYKEKLYEYGQLVADDMDIISKYNNDLHRDQKKYPNMTRMQVLLNCINPNLPQYDESLVARYIGEKVSTTIRRNQYVQVQYGKYAIPGQDVLDLLQPNNYNVEAYYLPNGIEIPKVYLYQNEEFICEAIYLDKYNEATSEQTDTDRANYGKQAAFVARFDGFVRGGSESIGRVAIINKNEVAKPKAMPTNRLKDDDDDFVAFVANKGKKRAIDNL